MLADDDGAVRLRSAIVLLGSTGRIDPRADGPAVAGAFSSTAMIDSPALSRSPTFAVIRTSLRAGSTTSTWEPKRITPSR